ncbi:MAG: hypothetical protein HY907_11730 [Deltaproteobacteria bacterium]|nr:hypothetical protein [Deltaproteobacteria bacterium]
MNPDGLDLSGPDRLLSLVGDVVVVLSPLPLPVGRRVDLSLGPDAGLPVSGKVIDVARAPDGFRLRIRLQSLPRARREALAALLPRP